MLTYWFLITFLPFVAAFLVRTFQIFFCLNTFSYFWWLFLYEAFYYFYFLLLFRACFVYDICNVLLYVSCTFMCTFYCEYFFLFLTISCQIFFDSYRCLIIAYKYFYAASVLLFCFLIRSFYLKRGISYDYSYDFSYGNSYGKTSL